MVQFSVTSLPALCNLILQDSETPLNPVSVPAHFGVETGIDATPLATADDPHQLVLPSIVAHQRSSGILLTSINFATSAEFACGFHIATVQVVTGGRLHFSYLNPHVICVDTTS